VVWGRTIEQQCRQQRGQHSARCRAYRFSTRCIVSRWVTHQLLDVGEMLVMDIHHETYGRHGAIFHPAQDDQAEQQHDDQCTGQFDEGHRFPFRELQISIVAIVLHLKL